MVRKKQPARKGIVESVGPVTGHEKAKDASSPGHEKYRRLADYHRQLNDVSMSFQEAADMQDLFSKIAEAFRLLTGAIAAVFSVYDQQTNVLKVVSLSTAPISRDKISSIFGPGLYEMRLTVSGDVREQMLSQIVRRIKDLHELTFGVISQDISNAIMDALGCRQIVALAVNYAEELVGTCIAYLPGELPVVPDEALITYAHISGLAVKRRLAEEALREREAQYRLLSEHTTDSVWLMDMDLKTTYHSPSISKIRGFTAQEIMELPLAQNLTPESLKLASALFLEELPRVVADPDYNPILTLELEYYCKDGTTAWAENKFSIIRDQSGKPISILGEARNITERKRIEIALKESEDKYRFVVENSKEAIFIDVNGILKFGNGRTTELTGYSQEEYLSRSIMEFIHPEDRQMVVSRYLQQSQDVGVSAIFTFRLVCKSGGILWVEVSATNVIWEGSPATLNFMTDITDRKRLEEEQQRVEKLESLGLLAGGIAHDFNNILTAILGNISLARMDTAPGSAIHDSLEQAEKASLRAKELTQQLLTFSKGGTPVKKLASLDQLLRDTTDFVLSGSKIKCQFLIPSDLWHAEIDAGQVSQVIHNLVINAQHAMPNGGTIELKAENIALTEKQSLGRGLPLNGGDYIRIAVTDHGTGIPADHLDKIFDPFFTTKQKGSGLGLATSFSIARNHGGHLSVESVLGYGSTFYFYLPASSGMSVSHQEKKEHIKPSGRGRILVMDDEEAVRKIIARLLDYIGYKDVEFTADGAEVVEMYKAAMESGHPFDLVILDLTIPGGIGGDVAIKELLKIDPGVSAIVSSGYADETVMADYRKYGFRGMVAKPYTLDELRQAVQDVMG